MPLLMPALMLMLPIRRLSMIIAITPSIRHRRCHGLLMARR